MVVLHNEMPWQVATNFLLAATHGYAYGQCWRYDLINQRLEGLEGRISPTDALHLLEDASQDVTQWSITYDMTHGNLQVVVGRDYSNAVRFHVEGSVQ